MSWYRVELDDRGSVLSVTLQSKALESTRSVIYVEARGQEAAGKLAERLYSRRKVKERRAKYRAEGKCPCGRDRGALKGIHCAVCLENAKAKRERSSKGIEGGQELRLKKSAARVRDRKAEMRLEALCELQAKLGEFQSVAAARIWVQSEIRRLKGLSPIRSVG